MGAVSRRRSSSARSSSPLRRGLTSLMALLLSIVLAINLAVAIGGETFVNPFSPFFLAHKAGALARYLRHRAGCISRGGHGPLEPYVQRAARRHQLDPALLGALVQVESGSRPHRISRTGAMGPAQLMEGTARQMGVQDPFDPEQAIDGGARYLRHMLDRFGGDPALALAAYNAGPGSIVGRRVPHNGETEHYVPRVLAVWRARSNGAATTSSLP